MLNLLKQCLLEAKTDKQTFAQYYIAYLCQLQDDNIVRECQFLSRQADLNLVNMPRIIEAESQKGDVIRT